MDLLKITTTNNVRTISLNRPEKRNAFFPEMIRAITKAFKDTRKEKNLRAILLTGEGQSFCSGGDLEWMKSMAKYTLKQNIKDADELFEMYWTIRNTPLPVLGKVFGHAFGGGAGLTAVCDIVAAESKTQICFSEVKWGLAPAVISPFVSERAQPAFVREWFVTAKVFDAREAVQGGLINFAGSIDEVDLYLEKSLNLIVNSAPEAVAATKKLHQSYSTVNWKTVRGKVTKLIAARRVSDEGQKGLQAFLEKRTPKWSTDGAAPAQI